MAVFGGSNFTTFSGVNIKNTAAIRFTGDGTTQGTLSVKNSLDAARAWSFPDKTGTFPISGTFTVNLPAITANSVFSTNVTVAGIRTEDAIVAAVQDTFATIGTTSWAVRGFATLSGCSAANGGVHMTFVNYAATATVYRDVVVAYTTVR